MVVGEEFGDIHWCRVLVLQSERLSEALLQISGWGINRSERYRGLRSPGIRGGYQGDGISQEYFIHCRSRVRPSDHLSTS